MKRAMALLTGLAAMLLLGCTMPEPPRRIALLYGVSKYNISLNEGVYPNLSAPDDDADAMEAGLSSKGWEVIKRINTEASKTRIIDDIADLAGSNAIVLFYFSGHGVSYNDIAYICPYGAIDSNDRLQLDNSISTKEFYSYLKEAGLEHAIIILDSCYSGAFVEEGPSIDAIPPVFGVNDKGYIKYKLFLDAGPEAFWQYVSYSESPSYVVLSAAGSEELSYETSSWGHGVFTYAVLKAMEDPKADLDKDHYVDSSELFEYTKNHLNKYWNNIHKNDYVMNSGQYMDYHPHLSGSPREYALWKAR
ncbi:hypothetical protein MASR2M29_21070 [Spirochaetota bacterium]